MKRVPYLLAIFMFVAIPGFSFAADESLDILKKEIKSLEKKVNDIETQSNSNRGGRSVADLNGYMDFSFEGNNQNPNVSPGYSSFHARTLSLFVGKEVGRWRMFSEVEFADGVAHDCAPGPGCSGQGALNLETLWMEYSANDTLHLRAGILLVPTYWRVNHYPSVTLSTEAPLMNEVIFPPSLTGAMVYGKKYFGSFAADYRIYVGNGEGDGTNKPAAMDNNDHKALGSKIVLDIPNNDLFDRFQIGGHFYTDISLPSQRKSVLGGEWIVEKYPFTLLAEFARAFVEQDQAGVTPSYDQIGYYFQPSLHVSSRTSIFYRYDFLNSDTGVPDLNASPSDETRNIVGVNVKPIPEISIKGEYYTASPRNTLAYPEYSGWVGSMVFYF
jgi:hypothetical protein